MESSLDWEIDQSGALTPQLYKQLKQSIVRAEFQPGQRISDIDIANRLGVSRQPVREAFLRLQNDGLLEMRPQRGTFINRISVSAVLDARFVREAIEADIVYLLARSPDKKLITNLRRQLKAQRRVPQSAPHEFMKLDETFHRTLAEAAGKSHAWQVLEDVKTQMDRVRFLSFTHFHVKQLIEQHTGIVDAIASGHVSEAVSGMRTHLQEILKSLPGIISENSTYFTTTNNAFTNLTIVNVEADDKEMN